MTSSTLSLPEGNYRLTLSLAGNQYDGTTDTASVVVETALTPAPTLSRTGGEGFTPSTIDFPVGPGGASAQIVIDAAGDDNRGLLLDWVRLEQLS